MEDTSLARRLQQFLQALVAAEMEQIGDWHAQQVAYRKPAQPLRHRVGIEELVRVRVEQEERIARLLKQRLCKAFELVVSHDRLSEAVRPPTPKWTQQRPSRESTPKAQ